MSGLTEQKVAELKAEHGEIYLLETANNAIVFKPAPVEEWERFERDVADPKRKPQAIKTLVLLCTVYPEREEMRSVLANYPFLATRIAGEIANRAADIKLDEGKKLLVFFATRKMILVLQQRA